MSTSPTSPARESRDSGAAGAAGTPGQNRTRRFRQMSTARRDTLLAQDRIWRRELARLETEGAWGGDVEEYKASRARMMEVIAGGKKELKAIEENIPLGAAPGDSNIKQQGGNAEDENVRTNAGSNAGSGMVSPETLGNESLGADDEIDVGTHNDAVEDGEGEDKEGKAGSTTQADGANTKMAARESLPDESSKRPASDDEMQKIDEGKRASGRATRAARKHKSGRKSGDAPPKKKTKHDVKWDGMLTKLAEYRAEKGDCNVPLNYPEDKQLGTWVNTQRYQYKKWKRTGKDGQMTDERARKLKGIGFVWALRDCDCSRSWEDSFQLLKAYKAKEGDCNVPTMYAEDPQLGTWVKNQRAQYRLRNKGKGSHMTDERVGELNSIDFKL